MGGLAEKEDPHVTLTYHHKMDSKGFGLAKTVLEDICKDMNPLDMKMNGMARFGGDESDFLVMLVDSPSLADFRNVLTQKLTDKGVDYAKEHGFTPHITLKEVAKDKAVSIPKIKPVYFTADRIELKAGEDKESYSLNGDDDDKVSMEFSKFADEQRYTFGLVYKASPGRSPISDAHNEYAEADDLQQALWNHVRAGQRDIYVQHGLVSGLGFTKAGEWVEITSWPYPVKAEFRVPGKSTMTKEIPAGSVWMGVIWEPWAWGPVKTGQITGYSFGGTAKREDG